MNFVCCIIKAKNICSEYVIFIVFPRQKCLQERAPLLRYTYIACLVIYNQGTEVYCGDATVAQSCWQFREIDPLTLYSKAQTNLYLTCQSF